MRCSFRFAPFGNNVLLTNDAGKYAFLTPEEFRLFVSDQMDQNSETWRMLCERHFATEGTRETYLQQARQAVVGNHAYLFRGTSPFHFSADESVQQPMRLLSGSRLCKTGGYDA